MKKTARCHKYIKTEWQEEAQQIVEDLKQNNDKRSSKTLRRHRLQYPLLSHLLRDRLYDDSLESSGTSVHDLIGNKVEVEPTYSQKEVEKYCRVVEGSISVDPLARRCMEVIAQNLDRYDTEYIQLALLQLPCEHTLLLSAMSCRENTITDHTVMCFVHSTTEQLILGGSHLSDVGFKKVFPFIHMKEMEEKSVADSWEDTCEDPDYASPIEITGCPNLRNVAVLSPCITRASLFHMANLPFSKIESVTVYGKCSLPCAISNCQDILQTFSVSQLRGQSQGSSVGGDDNFDNS